MAKPVSRGGWLVLSQCRDPFPAGHPDTVGTEGKVVLELMDCGAARHDHARNALQRVHQAVPALPDLKDHLPAVVQQGVKDRQGTMYRAKTSQ